MDTAFGRFFKKLARFPKFHSKSKDKQSFRVPQAVEVRDGRLHVPKFREGIKIRQHRPMEGDIRHATISKNRAGQYYAAIGVRREIPKLLPVEAVVGVDLGVKNLATLSDNTTYPNIKPYRTLELRMKRFERSLSRKMKGSNNREKAKRKLARLHQKVTDIRNNHLHQATRRMVNENQVIIIEDLNIGEMLKNHHLAKSVQDSSLSEMVRQLRYKTEWYGRLLLQVGRWYPSSKTCHDCGFVNQDLTLADREWDCPRCGKHHDRDFNASLNIRDEGLRTVGTTGIACGTRVSLVSASSSC